MSKLKDFSIPSARMMPVIILADISGSMKQYGKIEALNRAIAEMIKIFADEQDVRAEIHVAVITFGEHQARLHQALQPADQIKWIDMEASGVTPMAAAFELATQIVEDKNIIPSRSYHPNLVLISDGHPTNEKGQPSENWKTSLEQLLNSERAAKAMRFAMGIGIDADEDTLKAFLTGQHPEIPVFRADETNIQKFFRWVTVSVTSRSRSVNPNSIIAIAPDNLDDWEF
ncbi:hypothetical protein NIES21_57290 (plasmid) [Anabaenopsis circularis NIES-21]|uniref:VWFA domain-containing protein n=1 Tax=Anabaenopsis circularis NIES-21 TaxID=1085406 RepID=A0A1Z4GQU9_9CYAN|nr:hypothetical protein NIES21_57290 [Anabaenopsis circularis NIES-21]